MSYPERIVPDEEPTGIVAIHLKRYQFALPYCEGKEVLDAGCGAGYGSAELGRVAARVLGVDVSGDAVAYAQARYGSPNVAFAVQDLLDLDLPDASFDVVCSFEVIEHLPDRGPYLENVARVLRPTGVYLVSTPRAERTTESPDNPHHRIEYSLEDFRLLLGRYFRSVELFGQRRLQTTRHRLVQRLDVLGLRKRLGFLRPASVLLGTPRMDEVTTDSLVISSEGVGSATELVAVCRGPSTP